MIRAYSAALLSLALISTTGFAQDGPLRRAGRALDQTGKNIRSNVESGVASAELSAQERDILNRVGKRIEWDKQLVGSTLRLEARPGGVVILLGSVLSEPAKLRVVDLASNTIGVTSVVDQLAVVKEVKVIETRTPAPAVEVITPVVTPPGAKVIVRP